MGNALLSPSVVAEVVDATEAHGRDASTPLVLVDDPGQEAAPQPPPASLSAWDPGNRANPICEVMPPRPRWPLAVIAVVAGIGLAGTAVALAQLLG